MLLDYTAASEMCLATHVTVDVADERFDMFVYPDDGISHKDFTLFDDISSTPINKVIDNIANIPIILSESNSYEILDFCVGYNDCYYNVRLEDVNDNRGRESTLQAILIIYAIVQDYFKRKSLDLNALLRFMIQVVYRYYGSIMLELFISYSAEVLS